MLKHKWLQDVDMPKPSWVDCPTVSQALFLASRGQNISQNNHIEIVLSLMNKACPDEYNIQADKFE